MPIVLNGATFNNGGTVTFNGQTVKEVRFNGTTVWKAEQPYNDVTVASNYAYGGQGNWSGWRTQMSSVNYDMRGYSKLTFTFSSPLTHTWANGNGDQYECYVYVNFNGTDYNAGFKSGTMFTAGQVETWTNSVEVSLTGYTDTQLQKVNFKSAIRVKKPSSETGDKRIGADLTVTNIIAE